MSQETTTKQVSKSELIYNMVGRFKDKEITQEELTEYCNSVDELEPMLMSQLKEYSFQVELDQKSVHLFNEMKELIAKLQFGLTFDTDSHAEEVIENNEEVAINISKLVEKRAIQYRFVSTMLDEMGELIGSTVKSAGIRIFNKMSAVLRHMAYDSFGEEFDSKHSEVYMRQVMERAEERNKDK